MSRNVVAERYGLALFQLAQEKNLIPTIENELRAVKKALDENKGFITLLSSPKLSVEEKKKVLEEVFPKVSPLVSNTLKILINRHRQNDITDVAQSFIHFANEENGIAEATVYSVRPLTADESKAVSEAFAPQVGKQSLNIENVVDSNLLGGLRIRIGNRIFDGSLQGKLNRLERTLMS